MFFMLKKILQNKSFYTGVSIILFLGVLCAFSYFVTDSSTKIIANMKRISKQIEKKFNEDADFKAAGLKDLHSQGIAREIPCLTEECRSGLNVYSKDKIYNLFLVGVGQIADDLQGYSFVVAGLSSKECTALALENWGKRLKNRAFVSYGVSGCPFSDPGIGVYHTKYSAPTKEEFKKACKSFNTASLGRPIPDELSDCYRFVLNVSFD